MFTTMIPWCHGFKFLALELQKFWGMWWLYDDIENIQVHLQTAQTCQDGLPVLRAIPSHSCRSDPQSCTTWNWLFSDPSYCSDLLWYHIILKNSQHTAPQNILKIPLTQTLEFSLILNWIPGDPPPFGLPVPEARVAVVLLFSVASHGEVPGSGCENYGEKMGGRWWKTMGASRNGW